MPGTRLASVTITQLSFCLMQLKSCLVTGNMLTKTGTRATFQEQIETLNPTIRTGLQSRIWAIIHKFHENGHCNY